ncbi:hypothetical protein TRP8649_04192 [Pelagimonas phthalicica]|uniref:Uncharacterized protein n=1 Tax=Pelagimonas phthalicica TaxID=1037362 RepID=A0A238JJE4_9RHOB|nr:MULTISPECIES: hypothetical protein [Roseobacteraceae]MBO9465673.1 hypothetical protein [Tropicibacter sp. R15_0]TDS89885.1 hypothetical protein CLV87_3938 [Pelagimonas phthalicica]SMX30052.1 hypothetical protein TRP8649_04192 [Pelagimonas phthalicica]
MKTAFLICVCLACLLVLLKNQIWSTGTTLALDILLASIVFACVGALIVHWKLSRKG